MSTCDVIKSSRVIKRVRAFDNCMIEAKTTEDADTLAGSASVLNRADAAPLTQLQSQHYERGFREGYETAWQSFQQQVKLNTESLNRFAQIVEQLTQEQKRLQQEIDSAVIALALAIAERIIKREVQLDETIVLKQIKDAIKRVIGVERVKIRIHPEDEKTIREHKPELLMAADSVREAIIETDEKVERGGCILESDSGNIDARLTTQLKALETALLKQVA